MKTVHSLKIAPEYYFEVRDGNKTFEIRNNDRNFIKGDLIVLRCWSEEYGFHCQPEIQAKITYITSYNQTNNFVVFSFKVIKEEI